MSGSTRDYFLAPHRTRLNNARRVKFPYSRRSLPASPVRLFYPPGKVYPPDNLGPQPRRLTPPTNLWVTFSVGQFPSETPSETM
jgi:hypothetical protein